MIKNLVADFLLGVPPSGGGYSVVNGSGCLSSRNLNNAFRSVSVKPRDRQIVYI